MNTQLATVTVYNFRSLDSGFESAPVSSFKATPQAIAEVFGGDLVEGTGERIDVSKLDADGSFRRRPTGWGELS
jgi:hypothetical protein